MLLFYLFCSIIVIIITIIILFSENWLAEGAVWKIDTNVTFKNKFKKKEKQTCR